MNHLIKQILKIGLGAIGLLFVAGIIGSATKQSDVSVATTQSDVLATTTDESSSESPVAVVISPVSAGKSLSNDVSANASSVVKSPSSVIQPSSYETRKKTSNCIANQALPDSACTPGAILTTDTSIICVSGYTQTVRDVPDSIRKQVFAEYGIDYSLHSNYEVDHLISLELGGSNDISNLFPESYSIQYGARVKDTFENYLHSQACSGKISMTTAQQEIATNWLEYYLEWKGSTTPTIAAPTSTIASPSSSVTPTQTQTFVAYYTSSYSTSKYYYPADCSGWKSLSPSYLKSFDTLQALLAAYPSRTLSPQCQ